MLTDGVKALDKIDSVNVKELTELLDERIS